jgi:ribonuclease P protein component
MQHFYLRLKSSPSLRIVISVSKKVSKKAVVRNTIRRRVKAALEEWRDKLGPATYFIVANPGAESVRGLELKSELRALMKPEEQ